MLYNARILGLILAIIITVLNLLLFSSQPKFNLWLIVFISFTCSFGVIYLVLHFMIFREIEKMDRSLKKIITNNIENFNLDTFKDSNPFQKIIREFYLFGRKKQKENNDMKRKEVFRKEFIADVSHELKTPLFAAQGFVHTLVDGAIKDKQVRHRFLKKAAKSLDHLDILVQDLLTLSQIELGEIKMNIDYIDLRKLCREVINQFEEKAHKNKLKLILQKTNHKLIVQADGLRLMQVVTNLVSNAIKNTNAGGTIKIHFKIENTNITTIVTDSGDGIPTQHLHRIFERFYRVDKSRSREKGGSGLGLAIVKHIIEGHHSHIEVESKVNKGSSFSFQLPMVSKERKASESLNPLPIN